MKKPKKLLEDPDEVAYQLARNYQLQDHIRELEKRLLLHADIATLTRALRESQQLVDELRKIHESSL